MIGKVLRGRRADGLLRYLFGPGTRNEHTNPRLVAGWVDPDLVEPELGPDGRYDTAGLARLLHGPLRMVSARAARSKELAYPVWHCVLRAAPEDRRLDDAAWARITGEVMRRTGLDGRDAGVASVRWVAVRHADDHVHIVATLAREDGRVAWRPWEYLRVREACRWAEETYGLRVTNAGDRTAAARPSRAETERATRMGKPEPARVTLRRAVRQAAAVTASSAQFVSHLSAAGYEVELRYSHLRPEEVTGYKVGMRDWTNRAGEPVWFAGRSLAPDLTWPKLSARWGATMSRGDQPAGNVWRAARAQARQAEAELGANPDVVDRVSAGTADLLCAVAMVDDQWRGADEAFARAGRRAGGGTLAYSATGARLRLAAQAVHAAVPGGSAATGEDWWRLAQQLLRLAETISRAHAARERNDQAAAARIAADHLSDITRAVGQTGGHHQSPPRAQMTPSTARPPGRPPAGPRPDHPGPGRHRSP